MRICGFQKTSFVDYPGEICSTVFVGGCNLRCPFCFNRDLVLQSASLPTFPEEEVLSFMQKRLSLQGALCISGGEPSLQSDLAAFLAKARKEGLKVKLDTNGTFPQVLERLLEEGNLDYIAVDIKAPPEKYSLAAGVKVDFAQIERTIHILKNSTVRYEFRTTLVPSLLEEGDPVKIAKLLAGAPHYSLQQFQPLPTLLDESLRGEKPLTREKAEEIASLCRNYVETVQLKGF